MEAFRKEASGALDFCRRLIELHGARPSASQASVDCARSLAAELRKLCGQVSEHGFKIRIGAFPGFVTWMPISILLVTACHLIGAPFVGALVMPLVFTVVFLEYILYLEILDSFYPQRQGLNVSGVLEPRSAPKLEIILSAHHDSAREFRLLRLGPRGYALISWLGLLGFTFVTLAEAWYLAGVVTGQPVDGTISFLTWLLPVAAVVSLPFAFFFGPNHTPGAGDNLIACTLNLELLRHFADGPNRLEHVRLRYLSFDAEEAGLRGSRRWVREQMPAADVPLLVLNLDSIYDHRFIKVVTRDLNGTMNLSREMDNDLLLLAQQEEIPVGCFPMWFGAGATDAASFAKAGIPAASILAMNTSLSAGEALYHTMNDKVENLDPEAVRGIMQLLASYIASKDRLG